MIKINSIILDGKVYSLGYKVVTKDLKSLGMHKNPNIIQYSINKWYYEPDQIEYDEKGRGGIWVARTLSSAKTIQKNYPKETRIFRTALDKILYFNGNSLKTNKINMFEEVTDIEDYSSDFFCYTKTR